MFPSASRKDVKVTLLYPPNQSWPETMCKPNGSLAYPNLAAALTSEDIEVAVYDACVGNEKDVLQEVFYQSQELPTGLLKTGVSDERILEEVADSELVGLTSIFSDQETMVLETARLIKAAYPEKTLVAGGVNARSRLGRFFSAGFDLVCLSEADRTLVSIVDVLQRRRRDFSGISALAFLDPDGNVVVNDTLPSDIVWDLDELPIPAWDLLPNERYWQIGRPHGGHFEPGEALRYASMVTSMGCVFSCAYCHIGGEGEGSPSGPIGRFRVKSDARVLAELETLRGLGVKQIFIEDDSLLGMKKRAMRILSQIRGQGFDILDVNGVNVVHLFKNHKPDEELLRLLMEAGFKEIVLPFESGTQRIITRYASNKWNVEEDDVLALIRKCKDFGLIIAGNYMLGYPDETREEIDRTVQMARRHKQEGLDSANFFLVMPLPGTPLFETAVQGGYLPKEFDPDRMNWTKANMRNTPVPPRELEEIRERAWSEINDADYVAYKTEMTVAQA